MKHIMAVSVLLLFLSACSSNKTIMLNNENDLLLGYSITFGQRGGFTGNNQGYYIDSSGTVRSFSGIILKDAKMEYKGRLKDDQIVKIRNFIPSVAQVDYKEKGNITNYIILKNSDGELRFSWPGPDPAKDVPQPLVEFNQILNDAINSIKQ